jgi:hypothetical protein
MNTAQIEWARTRIRSAAIVNGKYELDVQRETNMGNLLFIPGLTSPVAEIRQLLFGQGQPGGSWIPSLSSAMIAANSFGSGVTDILDLSGNNNPFSQSTPASKGAWFREPKRGRVNLVLRSQEIDQSPWTVTNLNRTANATIAPDGTLTADKIFADTTAAATHNVRQTVVVTSGSNLTFSFYAKAAEYGFIRFWEDTVTGQQGFFNLNTGVATNSTLVSVGMEDAGNGWWRCFGRLNSFGGTNFGFRLHPTPDGTTTVYNGDGVSGVFVWQCQLEV